jgi:ATP-dependent DNA helicase PIF1
MLSRVRIGTQTEDDIKLLKSLTRPITSSSGIQPTWLTSINNDAININRQRLSALPHKPTRYIAVDKYKLSKGLTKYMAEKLLNDYHRAPAVLDLKPGAQVIITQNIDVEFGITNGTRAIVKSCTQTHVTVAFDNGTEKILSPMSFFVGPKEYCIKRKQMPLQLAWALTIHKSQGLTISKLVINASHIFAAGQLYTALSRTKSIDDLQLIGFNESKIKVDGQAIEFYNSLT